MPDNQSNTNSQLGGDGTRPNLTVVSGNGRLAGSEVALFRGDSGRVRSISRIPRQESIHGFVTHRLIASVADRFGAGVSFAQVVPSLHGLLADVLDGLGLKHIERRAAIQAALTRTAVYVSFLAPPADAVFVGAEVPTASGGRFDLVWNIDGKMVVDEVKAGTWAGHEVTVSAVHQCHGYRQDGHSMYGAEFGGVRLCLLTAPQKSAWFTPQNRVVPLPASLAPNLRGAA